MANLKHIGLLILLCPPLGACAVSTAAPHDSEEVATAESAAPRTTPASCDTPHRMGEAHVRATVRVDRYVGLHKGFNGTHEIFEGTVTDMTYASDQSLIDSMNVQVAMNVMSSRDPRGLPNEIKLTPGELVELEGDYVPEATASAHTANGAAAVIHYTHAPCGSVTIDGMQY
jgi:hypothetical protein